MEKQITLIVTGRYGQSTPEINEMVDSILGGVNCQDRFNVYFNWYNTVHEIGHMVEVVLRGTIDNLLDGELFANAFAVAFWARYGERQTFETLKELVSTALERFERPISIDEDLTDFARRYDAGEIEFSFNNYGWFQFSLVNHVLSEMRSLESVLVSAGFAFDETPAPATLAFPSIGEDVIPEILVAVFTKLREWGIELPFPIYHMLIDDPNAHMVLTGTLEEISDMGLAMEGANPIWVPERQYSNSV